MDRRRHAFVAALFITMLACGRAGIATPGMTTDVPAATATQGKPVIVRKGVAPIVLLTATTGVGAYPLFEWEAVPGAAYYTLVVKELDGRPYWSWTGDGTSVYLGGGSVAPPEDSVGLILLRPMTWSVFAVSADHTLVGSSPARPIAP